MKYGAQNFEKGKNSISGLKLFLWKWWRSIDQQIFIAVAILISFSLILVTTASSAIASRIGIADNYFSSRHVINIIFGFIFIFIFSLLNKKWIRRISIMGFIFSVILLILVPIFGVEVKGAKRWVSILGFSVQPSEFIKPFFSVIVAWIFSISDSYYKSFIVTLLIYILVAILLISQPDLGMLITFTGIYSIQLFISGLPLIFIILSGILSFLGLFLAYINLSHVQARIDSFLNPNNFENYQVKKSILAFQKGNIFGQGPGEGYVKQSLPDSHTDFIFAVAGEEFGALACIFVSMIFAFIVIKSLLKSVYEKDKFIQISIIGIISQIGLQSSINMGVALNLLPTKGMTLPFISYGGSSTIAVCIAIGMLFGLSRVSKNYFSAKKYKILNLGYNDR